MRKEIYMEKEEMLMGRDIWFPEMFVRRGIASEPIAYSGFCIARNDEADSALVIGTPLTRGRYPIRMKRLYRHMETDGFIGKNLVIDDYDDMTKLFVSLYRNVFIPGKNGGYLFEPSMLNIVRNVALRTYAWRASDGEGIMLSDENISVLTGPENSVVYGDFEVGNESTEACFCPVFSVRISCIYKDGRRLTLHSLKSQAPEISLSADLFSCLA